MTKVYKIEKITNSSLVNPLIASKINEIISEVNRLTLDEKKEQCNYYDWDDNRYIHEPGCNLRDESKKEEPKSTLKEEIELLVRNIQIPSSYATNKIISLFKDTLLKEMAEAEPLRIPGESLEFTSGQEWTMRQIKQIIKNI